MASETTTDSPPTEEHIAVDAANGAAADGAKKNGKRNNGKDKKKEVPIEELYDLSQPIKRVSSTLHIYGLSCIIHPH